MKTPAADAAARIYTSEHSAIIGTASASLADQVETEGYYSCAITAAQEAYCAGKNTDGQLGIGGVSVADQPIPVKFQLPAGKALVLNAGTDHICVLSTDQNVYCAGRNSDGQLGMGGSNPASQFSPQKFVLPAGVYAMAVEAATIHTCVLGSDQNVYCAGQNTNGQLGNGAALPAPDVYTPTRFALSGVFAREVRVVYDRTCVLTTGQSIYCAGKNTNGQMGLNTVDAADKTTPLKGFANLPAGVTINSMNMAYTHTCAVVSDQSVYCAGKNTNGQLGNGAALPAVDQRGAVKMLTPAGQSPAAVEVASDFTCVLMRNQSVYCAGKNTNGQLGMGAVYGTTDQSTPNKPFILPAGVFAREDLTVTSNYTCVVTTDKSVYCAGQNNDGQLGNGASGVFAVNTPVKYILPSTTAAGVSIAFAHTCVLTTNQMSYCAGYNIQGQLGNGGAASVSTPQKFKLP